MAETYRSSCDECSWQQPKPSKTQALADYAYRQHSCEKQRRLDASRARGEAREAAIDRTPKPCRHKQAQHQHSTYACYVLDACRCTPCTQANRDYEANRTRQQAYGRWNGLVDAEPARQHVRELMAAGMGLKRIIAVSDVSQGALWKLMYGKRRRGRKNGRRQPSRRITPDLEQRILAVNLDLADGARVDPTGAVRRIQALASLGYSLSWIGAELGIDRSNFTPIARGRRGGITVAHDQAVRELYDRWSMRPPVPVEHREKISVARTRRYAANLGWAPPLAWDDDEIDDPTARPDLGTDDPARRHAKLPPDDEIRWLIEQGESTESVAARFGVKAEAVERALLRARAERAA